MKKLTAFIAVIIVIIGVTLPISALSTSAEGAILLDFDSGEILYQKSPYKRLPMASTTKIMTALVVLENTKPEDIVTITDASVGVEGSSIYLTVGEKLTVNDLMYALLLESANDSAVALAVHTAGSVEAFADMMNKKALELGLRDTHFTNPHGLDDPEHYTSAYDLALITREAMKNAKFSEITSTYKATIPYKGDSFRYLRNHNRLIRCYEGAIGVKTGFTKRSGRCLVSAANRNGQTLIAVTIKDPSDWSDHTAMLDYGFDNYERLTLCNPDELEYEIPVVGGKEDKVVCRNTCGLYLTLERKNDRKIESVVELPDFIYAPVEDDTPVGRVVFYDDGIELGSVNLYTTKNIAKDKNNSIFGEFFEKLF